MKIERYEDSFFIVPLQLLEDKDLTEPQKLIFIIIWGLTAKKEDNKAIISSKTFEDKLGYNRMTIYRHTERLKELKYITKERVKTPYSSYAVTEYTLNLSYIINKYKMNVILQGEESYKKEKEVVPQAQQENKNVWHKPILPTFIKN